MQKQKRPAELHRGRERRVEALLAELLPVPDEALLAELQEPVATVAPSSLPVPARTASPRPIVTPRTGRPTSGAPLTASSRRAPTPASSRTPVPKRAVPPRPKEPETKLAPAAAALLASMHVSKYGRSGSSQLKAAAAAASAAMK